MSQKVTSANNNVRNLILVLTLLIVFLAISWYRKQSSPEIENPQPLETQTQLGAHPDDSSQTSTTMKLKILIPGGYFVNQCLSGEEGSFDDDGQLSITWGKSYTPDSQPDTNAAIARWKIEDDSLIIDNTKISDGKYSIFQYFAQNDSLIIDTRENKQGCGVIIGSSKTAVESYLQ